MVASLWLIWLILCLYDLRSILLILSAHMDLRPTGVCSRRGVVNRGIIRSQALGRMLMLSDG